MWEKSSFTSMTTKDSTIDDSDHRKMIETLQWIMYRTYVKKKKVTGLTLLNDFHKLMLYRRLPISSNENSVTTFQSFIKLEN